MNRRTAVAVTAVIALAACGVPEQDRFEALDPSSFAVDPPVTEPVPPDSGAMKPVLLPVHPYYVTESGLRVRTDVVLTSYEAILQALLTRPEEGSGMRTAVSSDSVLAIEVAGPGVVVELGEAFAALSAEEQRLAAAQLVLTITDRATTQRISFTMNDQPIDVPTADGTIASGGSVSRSDYSAVLAPT